MTGYWLSWQDEGRNVEVEIEGVVRTATLRIHDTYYDDEGEEFAVFSFVMDTGEELPFSNDLKWRYA